MCGIKPDYTISAAIRRYSHSVAQVSRQRLFQRAFRNFLILRSADLGLYG